MKYGKNFKMYNLILTLLLSTMFIATSINSNSQSLGALTPVEDPYEFQNEYYPIKVGNYWKYAYYNTSSKYITLVGYYEQTIIDYTLEEIYFGDSLYYLPVFRQEVQFISAKNNDRPEKTYTYFIQTEQGTLLLQEKPKSKRFKIFLFIPQNPSFDTYSEILTQKRITRDLKVKTKSWEFDCMKIELITKENSGGYYYSPKYGHVMSQFYSKDKFGLSPRSEFVLLEYKIK